jgi:hypothetical protein
MNICGNCTHWQKTPYKGLNKTIVADEVGECRGGTPVADFRWARTRRCDTCARWQPMDGAVAAVRVGGQREGETGRQGEIFEAGERAAAPTATLACTPAAAGSTSHAARPASIDFAAGHPGGPRNTRKTRKDGQ